MMENYPIEVAINCNHMFTEQNRVLTRESNQS